jgi:hypothetical protein
MHPNTEAILKYFAYEHLPPKLQEVSRPFCELARSIAEKYEGPEVTAGLGRLLESKYTIVHPSPAGHIATATRVR